MLCTYSLEHSGLCTVLQALTKSAYFWPLARETVRWQKLYILPWSKISTTSPSDLILQPKQRLEVQLTHTDFATGTNGGRIFTFFIWLRKIPRNLLFDNNVKFHHKLWLSNTVSSSLSFLALQHTMNTYFITPTSCTGLTWSSSPICLRNEHSAEGPELENLTFPSWLIVLFQLTCANRKDEQRPKAHPIRSPSPWLSVWEGLIFKVRGCSIGAGLLKHMCFCVCCPSWSLQHLH